jgi:phenylalanyl-tRNA synthetase alpha subunit
VTLPAPPLAFGKRHPLTQTMDDIVRIFGQLGYGRCGRAGSRNSLLQLRCA